MEISELENGIYKEKFNEVVSDIKKGSAYSGEDEEVIKKDICDYFRLFFKSEVEHLSDDDFYLVREALLQTKTKNIAEGILGDHYKYFEMNA